MLTKKTGDKNFEGISSWKSGKELIHREAQEFLTLGSF